MDLAAIKPEHLKALIVLERFFRDKDHAWPANGAFARAYGCKERQAQNLLRDVEELGYIRRIACKPHPGLGGGTRPGIVFRRRLNLALPVVDDGSLARSIERLRESRGLPHGLSPIESKARATHYVGGA